MSVNGGTYSVITPLDQGAALVTTPGHPGPQLVPRSMSGREAWDTVVELYACAVQEARYETVETCDNE